MANKWEAEFTDTFGGQANYSWVRRETFEAPDDATQQTIMRRAKAAVGLTGERGRTCDYGDAYAFRPYRSCMVLFVTWQED